MLRWHVQQDLSAAVTVEAYRQDNAEAWTKGHYCEEYALALRPVSRTVSAIHLTPMSDTKHKDDHVLFVYLVDHPVVADTDAQLPITTGQMDASRWPRILG